MTIQRNMYAKKRPFNKKSPLSRLFGHPLRLGRVEIAVASGRRFMDRGVKIRRRFFRVCVTG